MEAESYYEDAAFIMEEREKSILSSLQQSGLTPVAGRSPASWAAERGMIPDGGDDGGGGGITPLKSQSSRLKCNVGTLLGSALAREEYARDVFDRFDADRSGSIDTVELDLMLVGLGIDRSAIFGARSTRELVRYYDLDRDGALDFEEFVHLFNALNMYVPRSEHLGNDLMRTSSARDAAGQLSPKPGRHSHVVRRLDSGTGLGSQASMDDADADGVVTVLRTPAAGDAPKKRALASLVPDQATFARDYARAYSSFSTDVMDFSHNFLGSAKAGREFARLIDQNTLLRTVILRSTGIKLPGLRKICASLEKHPSITAVDLTGNPGLGPLCASTLASMLRRNRGIVHLKWDTTGCAAMPESVDGVAKVLAQNRRTLTIHKQGKDTVRTAAGTYRGIAAFEMLEKEEQWRADQSAQAKEATRAGRLAAGRGSMHDAIHGIDWGATGTAPHVFGRRSVMSSLLGATKAANRWRARTQQRKRDRARVRADAEKHALDAALDLDDDGTKFLSPRRAAGDTEAPEAAQDYRLQGNLDLYTDDALRQRELLKDHTLIKACTWVGKTRFLLGSLSRAIVAIADAFSSSSSSSFFPFPIFSLSQVSTAGGRCSSFPSSTSIRRATSTEMSISPSTAG